jgi:hypothetical protein
MDSLGVSTACVDVNPAYTTAESYVLSQPSDGERSIIMASGSTSQIDAGVMQKLWDMACATPSNLEAEEDLQRDLGGGGDDGGDGGGGGGGLLAAAVAAPPITTPRLVTTEVSQVPLQGVEALLDFGNNCGKYRHVLTVLCYRFCSSI